MSSARLTKTLAIRTQKRRRPKTGRAIKSATLARDAISQAAESGLNVEKANSKPSTAIRAHGGAAPTDETTAGMTSAAVTQSAKALTVPSPPRPAPHAPGQPTATPASSPSVRAHYRAPNGETFTRDEMAQLSAGARDMEKSVTIYFRPTFIDNPWAGMTAVRTTCLTSYL